jgi:hypothetical protein
MRNPGIKVSTTDQETAICVGGEEGFASIIGDFTAFDSLLVIT